MSVPRPTGDPRVPKKVQYRLWWKPVPAQYRRRPSIYPGEVPIWLRSPQSWNHPWYKFFNSSSVFWSNPQRYGGSTRTLRYSYLTKKIVWSLPGDEYPDSPAQGKNKELQKGGYTYSDDELCRARERLPFFLGKWLSDKSDNARDPGLHISEPELIRKGAVMPCKALVYGTNTLIRTEEIVQQYQ